jgi:hypothetical protein
MLLIEVYIIGLYRGFIGFSWFDSRKINPALAVPATAFFSKQTFIKKSADIKYSCCK